MAEFSKHLIMLNILQSLFVGSATEREDSHQVFPVMCIILEQLGNDHDFFILS